MYDGAQTNGKAANWPPPSALERALFPPSEPSSVQRTEPDWPKVHQELRRKGVTLELLWQEYKAEQTDGFQYSAFCEHYRRWRQRLTLSMRQTHTPGERLFIDYAGQTVGIVDGTTGEIREAQIFVAVLGASNYTFLEATWSQQLPDWIGSHVRALDFYGGCTELWVIDFVPGNKIDLNDTTAAAKDLEGVNVPAQEDPARPGQHHHEGQQLKCDRPSGLSI